MRHDVAIVGGGIIGLAVGRALMARHPGIALTVLEKEERWAGHQTGHNSGVIHSGIYYRPGSLKARFARAGSRSIVEYCQERGVQYEICGKLIVATRPEELPRLETLYERGVANGLRPERVGPEEIREHEPHVSGIAGLRVPEAGIVDYSAVARELARELEHGGAELRLGAPVLAIRETGTGVVLRTPGGAVHARFLVNCAGLHSDRVARMAGLKPPMRIVPFRGEYYELVAERRSLVRNLVYPVPDPAFPFLGVHFTRMIDGTVHAGPNAVLGLRREGYRKRDVSLRDAAEVFSFGPFWSFAARHWREGAGELLRSFSKHAFVQALRRLVPEVEEMDLIPAGAGVRAQALGLDGRLLDDFVILGGPNSLHVCNAPSPGATASLEIGKAVAAQVPMDRIYPNPLPGVGSAGVDPNQQAYLR